MKKKELCAICGKNSEVMLHRRATGERATDEIREKVDSVCLNCVKFASDTGGDSEGTSEGTSEEEEV